MYCRYCGKQLEDGTVICPGCGRLTDDGQKLVKPVAKAEYVPETPKKERLSKCTIVALVAFSLYIFGVLLNTIVTTSNTMDAYFGQYFTDYEISKAGTLAVSGIFSILTLTMGITAFALSFAERVSASRRIFPFCMMIVGVAYFIEFLCAVIAYGIVIA